VRLPKRVERITFTTLAPNAAGLTASAGKGSTTIRFDCVVPNG
jgi:hypothetical protein